jgi:hypothetical protein
MHFRIDESVMVQKIKLPKSYILIHRGCWLSVQCIYVAYAASEIGRRRQSLGMTGKTEAGTDVTQETSEVVERVNGNANEPTDNRTSIDLRRDENTTNETTERMKTRREPGPRAVKADEWKHAHQRGP